MLAKTVAKNRAVSGRVQMGARTLATWDCSDPKLSSQLSEKLIDSQADSAKTLVPWFLKNMPDVYFRQVPEEIRLIHLKAAAAFKDFATTSDLALKIENKRDDGSITVTNFNNSSDKGMMLRAIKSLEVPSTHRLGGVGIYQTSDKSLSVQMFTFKLNTARESATAANAQHILNLAQEIRAGDHAGDASYPRDSPLFSEDSLQEYFKVCSPGYCSMGNPRRFLIQRRMYERVRSTDKAAVHVENGQGEFAGTQWITMAVANVLPDVIFRIAAKMLFHHDFDVQQSHMDRVMDPANDTDEMPGFVTMLRLNGRFTRDNTPEHMQDMIAALKRAKWYDEETVDFGLARHPEVGLDKSEVITCMCSMLHGPLSKLPGSNSFGSISSIIQTVECDKKFVFIADKIAALFIAKFDPDNTISESEYNRRERELRSKIAGANPENAKTDPKKAQDAKIVLDKMLDAVTATKRTNFFNSDRYALSLRVDPVIMATDGMGEPENPNRPMPFGVYFAHGRHFNAFHCRFRDVARGGLRVVTPPNADTYASDSSKHFDEVYNLSYAQQLKNKDIPEGGAKAVILLNTPIIHKDAKFFAMRKSIRAFTDSCFDLMVQDSVSGLVDYLKRDELLYFGPDEQVIPSDIDWITQRAAQRNYPTPNAFMSSKPLAGFNHKEFGVTSEGVAVFLDVALRKSLGIDPKSKPWTVKITGGPDGDVAGNLMKILIRDYPNTVRIVGIADGFGVAEDPNGLDHSELLRLFNSGSPINKFNSEKLSADGCMFDASTEEGAARRNSMVFRVKADAFVPGGGRPGTIDKNNWNQFLDADGVPTSKLIVEGANLFNTAEARVKLHGKGVAIVKDSSANKCGVMTSSYEVQASMILSKEEFLANKPEIVEDVYRKLRMVAGKEAELLFREYNNYPGSLVQFSERISNAINKVTDAITDRLSEVEPSDPLFKSLMPLIKDSLPNKLAELGWERVPARFPAQYQRCVIASALASRLVYQEGIHLVEAQPSETIATRAIAYYFEDERIKKMVSDLDKRDLGLPDDQKKEVMHLLRTGGARTALDIF